MAWEIDATHSSARLLVRRMTSTTVRGPHAAVCGYLNVDEDTPAHTWMDVRVDVARLDYEAEAPDSRVPSVACRREPGLLTFSFRSMIVEPAGGTYFKVGGELTILGTTRPVIFHADVHERDDTGGAHPVILSAWAKINRRDFAIPPGTLAEPERVSAGETFTLELDLAVVSRAPPSTMAEIEPEGSSERGLLQAA